MALALDEPKQTDKTFEIDGFTYIIDQEFLEKINPVKIDFTPLGFNITSSVDFSAGASGCSACGTGTCG